jgi:hypothetical protein
MKKVKTNAEFLMTMSLGVEERLAAYDRFLGDAGTSIDPSIRSRLALDAALLHRERGESERFVQRLTQAASLDPTNKSAASLAVGYYADRIPDDPLGQLQLLINLLYSDPFDPNVHMSIATLLAQEGSLLQSARFHNSGMALLNAADAVGPERDVERLALGWQLQGPASVVSEIDRRLQRDRSEAAAIYERDLRLDVPDDQLVPPETVHLNPLYEKMRVLAALSGGDFLQVERGLEELRAIATEQAAILQDPTRSLDPIEEQQRLLRATRALSDLQLMRAIANVQLDEFAVETQSLARIGPTFREALAPLAAWLAFRSGRPQEALEVADGIEQTDGPSPPLQILRGLANEALGSVDTAVVIYRGLVASDPLGPIGAWARNRVLGLLQQTDPRTEAGKQMTEVAAAVPDWFDRMLGDSMRFMDFSIEAESATILPGEPVRLRLTLTNVSTIPMGVGGNRAINSRFLLMPAVDQRDDFIGLAQPEVVEADHRLRLMPRESYEIIVDADVGFTGLLNSVNGSLLNRQRWRGVQGFELSARGNFIPGPLCRSDETASMLFQANPHARLSPAELASALRSETDPDVFSALTHAAATFFYRSVVPSVERERRRGDLIILDDSRRDQRQFDVPEDAYTAGELAPLAEALAGAYASQPAAVRAYMLGALPSAAMVPAVAPFDNAVRATTELPESTDPIERAEFALVLLTRVADADDPLLSAAAGSSDTELRRVAIAGQRRLSAGLPTLSSSGPGVNSIIGPTRRMIIEEARAVGGP